MHRTYSLLLLAAAASAQTDRWYELSLAEHPVGYYHESVRIQDDGSILTTAGMKMLINRMGAKVEFLTSSETAESPDGNLRSQHSSLKSSGQAMNTDVSRKSGSLEVTTGAAGKTYTQSLAAPDRLCGPAGLEQLTVHNLKDPGDTVSCETFIAELGKLGAIRRTLVAEQKDHSRSIEEELEGLPGKSNLLLAADGSLRERRQAMPFGELLIRLSDRATALSMSEGGSLPDEMYDRTLARSKIRLPDPRSIQRLKLRITFKQPDLGLPNLNGENQRVLEKTGNTLLLEVRQPAPPSASERAGTAAAEFLQPNSIVQSDDPQVRSIAKEAAGASGFPAARKLQDWVANHLKFDAGIALAPASEVIRDRRGTCIAYAVLLASLARSAGIPSRVAIGSVYEEGIWGGHAWTELRIGNRWIPLDAALYSPGFADAARFYGVVSSLQEGAGAITAAGLQLYGNIEVAVIEYTIHGKTIQVPADAQPYEIDGGVYRNRWLNTSLRKPAGFRFTRFDAVYPDPTVIAMEGPDGRRVHLEYRTALPNDKTEASGPTKLVVPDGNSVWVLIAEGPGAPDLLKRLASGWVRE